MVDRGREEEEAEVEGVGEGGEGLLLVLRRQQPVTRRVLRLERWCGWYDKMLCFEIYVWAWRWYHDVVELLGVLEACTKTSMSVLLWPTR